MYSEPLLHAVAFWEGLIECVCNFLKQIPIGVNLPESPLQEPMFSICKKNEIDPNQNNSASLQLIHFLKSQ